MRSLEMKRSKNFPTDPPKHTPNPQPRVYEGIPFIWGSLGMSGVCSRGYVGVPWGKKTHPKHSPSHGLQGWWSGAVRHAKSFAFGCGCFQKYSRGTPKWMVKIMEISLKWMIWGYPYFWKHPCFCIFCGSEDAWFDVVDSISCWEPALSFGKVFAMLHEETWCNQTGCGWKSHGSSPHKPHKSWIWANHLRWWFRLLSKGIPQKCP